MKWFLSFLTPFFLFSQSGVEIATLLDQKLAPKDLSNKAKMILTNSKGKSRTSEMVSKSLNRNEKQKTGCYLSMIIKIDLLHVPRM